MGLGKSLMALAVIWAFVKSGKCKAAIVCPSSLIENWKKEIKKWLGTKLMGTVYIQSGALADAAIKRFRSSLAVQAPLVVVSYEVPNTLIFHI